MNGFVLSTNAFAASVRLRSYDEPRALSGTWFVLDLEPHSHFVGSLTPALRQTVNVMTSAAVLASDLGKTVVNSISSALAFGALIYYLLRCAIAGRSYVPTVPALFDRRKINCYFLI